MKTGIKRLCLLMAFVFCMSMTVSCSIFSKKDPNSYNWSYEYDNEGNITAITDPGQKKTEIQYNRDSSGRIIGSKTIFSNGSVITGSFDEYGRKTDLLFGGVETALEYDEAGNVTGYSRGDMPKLSMDYDTNGKVVSEKIGSEWSILYQYDFLGRISRITTPAGDFSYYYDTKNGEVIKTLPNGIKTISAYSPDGKLLSITHASSGNEVIAGYEYGYNADGLVESAVEKTTSGTVVKKYGYDRIGRLVSIEDSKNGKTGYEYDDLGNITKITSNGTHSGAEYDKAGRLVNSNGKKCSYDVSGNLTRYKGSGKDYAITYNAFNKPETITAGGKKVKYGYDGDGRLIGRESGSLKDSYIYDLGSQVWKPLLERSSSGKDSFYIWDGDVPAAISVNGETLYYLQDVTGSARMIVDGSGNIRESMDYNAYGSIYGDPGSESLQPGFAGMYLDTSNGLYLTNSRVYNPETGRFLQIDPVFQIPDGTKNAASLYAYCNGDPVNSTDRRGTSADDYNDDFMDKYLQQKSGWTPPGDNMFSGLQVPKINATEGYDWDGFIKAEAGIAMDDVPGIGTWGNETLDSFLPSPMETAAWLVEKATGEKPEQQNLSSYRLPAAALAYDPYRLTDSSAADSYFGDMMDYLSYMQKNPFSEKTILDFVDVGITAPSGSWSGDEGMGMYDSRSGFGTSDEDSGFFPPSMSMEPVGGVSLKGAGEQLKNLGKIIGVSVDDKSGKITLLSEDNQSTGFSGMSTDDIVTIFRSVYEYGGPPFVSIDPDPADPKGPRMLIRHDKGTDKTYVGWILFEADRIMKTYSLGVDNITGRKVNTSIPGYVNLFTAGGNTSGPGNNNWERFWIVPSEITRNVSGDGRLTLFDIPLTVATEPMLLHNGKLVSAPGKKPSADALEFSKWFSDSFDKLNDETVESDPADPSRKVRIFDELRRITMISAIAEYLQAQGVPMPGWMKDYSVKTYDYTTTTPSITVKDTVGNMIRSIFGGVSLSIPDNKIKTSVDSDEASRFISSISGQLNNTTPYINTSDFRIDGKSYKAVQLPGRNTMGVGALKFNESDISIPLCDEFGISFSRSYNSFDKKNTGFGENWSMPLPKLESNMKKVERTDSSTLYTTCYDLTVGNFTISFNTEKNVEGYGSMLVPDKTDSKFLGVGKIQNNLLGRSADTVFLSDGQTWSFDDKGLILSVEKKPYAVIYRRDSAAGLISVIEGWKGNSRVSSISLGYENGLLARASGSNGTSAAYVYNGNAELIKTVKNNGSSEYEYEGGLLKKAVADKGSVAFKYDDMGRVSESSDQDGNSKRYSYKYGSDYITVDTETYSAGKQISKSSIKYDSSFKPVSISTGDGRRIETSYLDGAAHESVLYDTYGKVSSRLSSSDGKKINVVHPYGDSWQYVYDDMKRLVSVDHGGKNMASREWYDFGGVKRLETENTVIMPEYNNEFAVQRILLQDKNGGPDSTNWLEMDYENAESLSLLKDSSGFEANIVYNQDKLPERIDFGRGSIDLRYEAKKVNTVKTSWGDDIAYEYGQNGELKAETAKRGDKSQSIEYENGLPRKISGFNGRTVEISYSSDMANRPTCITDDSGQKIVYAYAGNRLTTLTYNNKYTITLKYDEKGRLTNLSRSYT